MTDFLDQAFPVVEAQAEPAAEAEVQPTPEAPVTEQPAPEPVTEPAPEPAPVPQQEHSIPLPKYLDERERRKDAERRIAEYEAKQAPTEQPDPLDDPLGYAAMQRNQFQSALMEQKVGISWELASEKHGAETVQKARDWALERANTDPSFKTSLDTAMATQTLPIEWIVRQHKRDGLLSDIGDNVDDWFTREAAKRGYVSQSAPAVAAPLPVAVVTQPAVRPAAPPRSIASEPAGSASTAGDPRADFMAIFDRK